MNIQVNPHTITITRTVDINAGEYNITTCTFEFSEEYTGLTKQAVFSTCEDTYKTPILNNQCTIPSEVLETSGQVLLGVYGYDSEDDELVLRYSPTPQYFNVSKGSYKEGNDPDLPKPSECEQVLALINQAITETNNLNITVEKEEHITTVTLTKKDGTTQTVQIEDGKSLEFKWEGTYLGIRQEGQSEYQYVNLKGDKGDAGAIKMIIVQELPQTGEEDTIYLVPLGTPESQENKYAEYVYIDNAWELLGKIGIEVDLTDYYTKTETNNLLDNKVGFTDYATTSTGGVIKVANNKGTSMSNGVLISRDIEYAQYSTLNNNGFISKGTLENVITGKGIVDSAKIKTSENTTAGNVYDVTYINSMIGDIETILTTLDVGSGI